MTPKIEIKLLSKTENIKYVVGFCIFDKNNPKYLRQNDLICKTFPNLKNYLNLDMPKTDKVNYISDEIGRIYDLEKEDMDKKVEEYAKYLNTYKDDFIKQLENVLNIEFETEEIKIYTGILPYTPRELETHKFYLMIQKDVGRALSIIIHNIAFYLLADKWKSMHRFCKKEDLEYPSLAWEYLEMIIGPVFENESIRRVFGTVKNMNYRTYDMFYRNNPELMKNLHNIFKEDTRIEERIQKGYRIFLDSKV